MSIAAAPLRRELRARLATGRRATRSVGPARARRRGCACARRDRVEPHAGLRRDDADVRAVDGEGRVLRRLLDARAEPASQSSAAGPPIVRARAAAGRQLEQRREPCAATAPSASGPSTSRTGAESATRAWRAARASAAARTCGCCDAERQLRPAPRAVERGELAHEHARRRGAVERRGPGRAGTTTTVEPVADERGVARRRGRPRVAISSSLYRSAPFRTRVGGVTSAPKTCDVEALEAADRAEAVALALRRVDRRLPVGLDAELDRADREALPAGDEDDRLLRDARPTALEQRAGVLRLHPADVDAVDRDAVRERRRRAGEDEPEHDGRRDDASSSRKRSRRRTRDQGSFGRRSPRASQKTNSSTPPETLSSMPVMYDGEVGAEEGDRVRDLLRLAGPLQGGPGDDPLVHRRRSPC